MKTLVRLLIAAALGLAAGQASADVIVVANLSPRGFAPRTVVLSDLRVSTTNPFIPFVEILKSGDATDDVTLMNTQSFRREIPQEISGFEISETMGGKEIKSAYLGTRTRIERRVSFLSDPANNPIFLAVDDTQLLDAPPEGAFFNFTNGIDPSRLDWFASILDPATGNVLGPYSGSAEVVSARFVASIIPEPSTLPLLACGVLALLNFRRRHAIRAYAS